MSQREHQPFQTIALLGKVNHEATRTTLFTLEQNLLKLGYQVIIESRTAEQLSGTQARVMSLLELGQHADLAIVVGGDGNMLGAARILCDFDIGVIGVNRGNLGFLTDLDPDHVIEQLKAVLAGDYQTEQRFLLQTEVIHHGQTKAVGRAINEVVLHSDKVAHMIEFEVYVDNQFVYSQRSDGLIISTPTGSTAYSLSGGGPIVVPNLHAISLVPMFPHTLSSRPIVVDATSTIKLRAATDNDDLQLSCDGHVRMKVAAGDEVIIQQHPHKLCLVHPHDHSYFRVLRNKLGWGSRLF
ncbi:MAG: NAD(+) kinase [Pseudidiomarina maritima]|nr:NAD(+) kinase [Pseudidiomarina maritima]